MKNTLVEIQRSAEKQSDAINLAKKVCETLNLKPSEVQLHTTFADMRTKTTDKDGFEVETWNPDYHDDFERIIRNDWNLPKFIGKVIECVSTKPTLNVTNVAVLGVKDMAAFERLKETEGFQEAFGTAEESRQGGTDVDF